MQFIDFLRIVEIQMRNDDTLEALNAMTDGSRCVIETGSRKVSIEVGQLANQPMVIMRKFIGTDSLPMLEGVDTMDESGASLIASSAIFFLGGDS